MIVVCLDGYCQLVKAVCVHYPQKLFEFLDCSSSHAASGGVSSSAAQRKFHQHIKKLQARRY